MKCEDCGTKRGVRLCQGDLDLCCKCETRRFPRPRSSERLENKGKMAEGQSDVTTMTIEDRLTFMCQKLDQFGTIPDIIRELQHSVKYMSDSFEDLRKEIQSLTIENMDIRKKLDETEGKLKTAENEIEELQQYTRRNNLEIHGIPETTNENTDDIVKKVAEAVDVEVLNSDIDISHRLPTRNEQQQPAIIVRFTRRSIRNQLYAARKKLQKKTTSDIGLHTPRQENHRIYINEQLTRRNKQLFHNANMKRKTLKWKYIWTQNGRIYVRKENDMPAIKISSDRDIQRIV